MTTAQYFVRDKDVIIFSVMSCNVEDPNKEYTIEFLKLHYYKVSGISRFFQSLKVVRDTEKNVAPFKLKKISEGYREVTKKAFDEYYSSVKEKSNI